MNTDPQARPKVYLAGPDIFMEDAADRFASWQELCTEHGLDSVTPLSDAPEAATQPRKIFQANLAKIRDCGAVIANMTPFRGPSMDVGTAFEMGFAHALEIPVFGWSGFADTEYKKRLDLAAQRSQGGKVEDFGLTDNLMVVSPVAALAPVAETFETAVRTAALFLRLSAKEG